METVRTGTSYGEKPRAWTIGGNRSWFLLLLILVFPTSCTTTSSSFEARAISESQQREASPERDRSDSSSTPTNQTSNRSRLSITSDPPGAGVFINGVFLGVTPLSIQNPPGLPFQVLIRKTGYRDHLSLHFGNEPPDSIQAKLEQIVGYLSIQGIPPERILIDGYREEFESGTLRLLAIPVGLRTITMQRFGFRDYLIQVNLREGETQKLSPVWIPEDLRLTDFSLSPSRVSPKSPGNLGALRFDLSVNGPGMAKIEILDRQLNLVYQSPLVSLNTWDHQLLWFGAGNKLVHSIQPGAYFELGSNQDQSSQLVMGQELPNGLYYGQVVLFDSTENPAGSRAVTSDGAWFVLDRGVTLYPRVIRGFGSGLLLVPTADVMEPLRLQYTIQGDGVFGSGLFIIPLSFGIRAGLFPGLELSVFGGGIFREDSQDNQLTLGATLKALVVQSTPSWISGAMGLTLSASHREFFSRAGMSDIDDQGDFPGVGGGLFGQLAFGSVALHGAWEIRFADTLPRDSWDPPNPKVLGAWSYYRAGLSIQIPQAHLGVSGALQSQTLGSQVPNNVPGSSSLSYIAPIGWVGYEAYYHLPNSWLSLGLYGRTVILFNQGAYTYGGGVISITPR
jgi:hypothetical protein